MEELYYLNLDQQVLGPYTFLEIKTRQLPAETLIRSARQEHWKTLIDLPEFSQQPVLNNLSVIDKSTIRFLNIGFWGALFCGILTQFPDFELLPGISQYFYFSLGLLCIARAYYEVGQMFSLKGLRLGAIILGLGAVIMLFIGLGVDGDLFIVIEGALHITGAVFIAVNTWPLQYIVSKNRIKILTICYLSIYLGGAFQLFSPLFAGLINELVYGMIAWLMYDLANFNATKSELTPSNGILV